MSLYPTVEGKCPMGCGETLVVAQRKLACIKPDCPRPSAAHEILSDADTTHVAVITQRSCTVKHPLQERLDDELLYCSVGNLSLPELLNEGTYREDGTSWVRVAES